MHAAPFLLSQVLQACRGNGSLRTQAQIHDPVLGNHGDLCVLGGFKADSLATTAENHDSQHKPYGICWSMAHGAATPKIPTKPYEDEEDEDNGSAQSLTVTTLASSSADGGVAQSLSVPQQVRNSENDGVAQSLSVAQQARRGNGVEMDMDMENQEERCWRQKVRNFLTDREMLEAESLHMIDPSGYTSAEADVREAIFRERLVRKQQQRNTSRSRALRQLAELDEREMEIE